MHIFLIGEIQIGKSTIIDKTLSLLSLSPQGFRTYFGPDRSNYWDRRLYMNDASKEKTYRAENVIVSFTKEQPLVLTERFNNWGAKLVHNARDSANLIIMDECGSFEQEAYLFQKEILAALDDSIPIIGVIKQNFSGWVDQIKIHPKVTLITVTKYNRDLLPHVLARQLIPSVILAKYKQN